MVPQALGIFELAQVFCRANRDLAVGADRYPSIGVKIRSGGKDAIPEIGFSRRAQTCNSAAARQLAGLSFGHMSRMDETPSA